MALTAQNAGVPLLVLADSYKDTAVSHAEFILESLPVNAAEPCCAVAFECVPQALVSQRIVGVSPQF